jgi:hypothetical protein
MTIRYWEDLDGTYKSHHEVFIGHGILQIYQFSERFAVSLFQSRDDQCPLAQLLTIFCLSTAKSPERAMRREREILTVRTLLSYLCLLG